MSSQPSMPDLKGIGRNDQIFLGAGVLCFIFTFISWGKVSVSDFGSGTFTAWHGIGTLAALLVLVAIVVGAMNLFSPSTLSQLPVSGRFIALAAAALAFVFFIIRWLTLPSGGPGVSVGLSWGGYVDLILCLAMIAGAFLGLQAAGESLPWQGGAATPPAAPPV
jgi:hypothetical protein